MQIILASENADLLSETALTLEREMRSLPQLSNVHQVTPRPGSELIISPKPAEAARLGFRRAWVPAGVRGAGPVPDGMTVHEVRYVWEAIGHALT